jgi:hypothetical protein
MRRSFQLSDGEIGGLFTGWFTTTVYVVVALILLWPLVNRFVIRRFRPPAHEVAAGHAHPLTELAAEIATEPAERAPARVRARHRETVDARPEPSGEDAPTATGSSDDDAPGRATGGRREGP